MSKCSGIKSTLINVDYILLLYLSSRSAHTASDLIGSQLRFIPHEHFSSFTLIATYITAYIILNIGDHIIYFPKSCNL